MGHLWRPYIGALFCTLLSIASVAQDGTPVFRTTSELVLLDVQVIPKKTDTSTAALQRKDLQVVEDGKPQEIAFFSRDELPLSVVMLFRVPSWMPSHERALESASERSHSASA